MMSVEEEYGLTIDEEQVQRFKTVGDVVRFIDEGH
jgi:acyl carrier protein